MLKKAFTCAAITCAAIVAGTVGATPAAAAETGDRPYVGDVFLDLLKQGNLDSGNTQKGVINVFSPIFFAP